MKQRSIAIPQAQEGVLKLSLSSELDIPSYLDKFGPKNLNERRRLMQQIVGAAGPFKEGDLSIGVAATSDAMRARAKLLLSNTRLSYLHEQPLLEDALQQELWQLVDTKRRFKDQSLIHSWSFKELKDQLLVLEETDIKAIMPALNSDMIAAVVKLMSNDELIQVGAKVFNALPHSSIGAKGYLSARIQPNSPTDHPEDIKWQVFNLWSYGVGDLMLGTNPVSSNLESVGRVEDTLRDIIQTFGLEEVLPWVVLAHIDIQAAIERAEGGRGRTALWFQSIAGTESANRVFGISTLGMKAYAATRQGPFGLYLETGQGADFSNGQAHGVDMGTLESRKYAFAKLLQEAQPNLADGVKPWVPVNDVAGFIGPEVFRTRDQLVRVALEDTVMGKLNGITIGLDICSTFHMSVSPRDLELAIDEVMPANPAYLMALPTKQDPMLSYLTTGIHDHLSLRKKYGYQINPAMAAFFANRLKVVDEHFRPSEHFGDPIWVYYCYLKAKGDKRTEAEIRKEGAEAYQAVRNRGVILLSAKEYTSDPTTLPLAVEQQIDSLYQQAKHCLHSELSPQFVTQLKPNLELSTNSKDRDDYILHPSSGEVISGLSLERLQRYRQSIKDIDAQIVISDGLNADALMDDGHLLPFLNELRHALQKMGIKTAQDNIIIKNGRVRAGYQGGRVLFGADQALQRTKTLIHIIGERPGTEHNNFSVYISRASVKQWSEGRVDHDMTRVVSGISDTALVPKDAVKDVVGILSQAALDSGLSKL